MGSTLPRSVISPVMATARRTGRLVNTESIAVAMVMPAEGPSFGIAPSGTCTWRSWVREEVVLDPVASAARAREWMSAACADSFITSPS